MVGELEKFRSLVFDCDGVLINSNRVKSDAFVQALEILGLPGGNELERYNRENGGISRYVKFIHYLDYILPKFVQADSVRLDGANVNALLDVYGEVVRKKLIQVNVTPGLKELRKFTAGRSWTVVSGGKESEVREVLTWHGIAGLFDGGIYGSPDSKHEILEREVRKGSIRFPAVFLGDSKYDAEVSAKFGLEFIFVSGWTEFQDWELFVKEKCIDTVSKLADLLGKRTR